MSVEEYLTSEEISFYEKGIPKFAGRTGTPPQELKDYLHKNPVLFFKKVGRYIARNPNIKYSLEKSIDDSNLPKGGKRKLKRVLLDEQEERIIDSLMTLTKEKRFQRLYSQVFCTKNN